MRCFSGLTLISQKKIIVKYPKRKGDERDEREREEEDQLLSDVKSTRIVYKMLSSWESFSRSWLFDHRDIGETDKTRRNIVRDRQIIGLLRKWKSSWDCSSVWCPWWCFYWLKIPPQGQVSFRLKRNLFSFCLAINLGVRLLPGFSPNICIIRW